MSNKACKLKICICAAAAESEALGTNLKTAVDAIAVLNAGDPELIAAGVDDVIAVADATVEHLRKLNALLVKMGVTLAS